MYIGTGLLALLAFLVLWFTGHFVAGVVVAIIILCVGGGGMYLGGPRSRNGA